MSVYKTKVAELTAAVNAFSGKEGARYCEDFDQASTNVVLWIEYLEESESTKVASEMLAGVRSALIEAAACCSLGLVRPALFSMRAQIDMLFGWLYFKDHKVEWQNVCDTGEGFRLKSDIYRYLETNIDGFKSRVQVLLATRSRTQDDPYRLLSAHVHSQSAKAIPSVLDLKSLVGSPKNLTECIQLQLECAEYLNDILFAYFAAKWTSLPNKLVNATKVRLSGAQAKVVFG